MPGAALRAQGVEALRHVQQGTMHTVKQPFAAFGQAHLAWQAFEERHAQPGFQGANLMRYRRGRHRQFLGRSLEAQQA